RLARHLLPRPERRPREGLRRRQEFVPLRRRGRSEASIAHVFDSTAQRLNDAIHATRYEILYSFYCALIDLAGLANRARHGFRGNSDIAAEPEGPRGKIRYAACVHLPARAIAANGLDLLRAHNVPGAIRMP